ncbi:hypothetical protein [Corynebacterium cystitidis]|uniref:hypothetical protein n=1 Tax=Corynebacterium cystitidis TaxID=35757 RepID=UPI0012FD9DB6|nr:hypothetical protein [Corynebacterium cystitidis]
MGDTVCSNTYFPAPAYEIPQAREELAALGVSPELIDEYLGIIHGRATTRRYGATW